MGQPTGWITKVIELIRKEKRKERNEIKRSFKSLRSKLQRAINECEMYYCPGKKISHLLTIYQWCIEMKRFIDDNRNYLNPPELASKLCIQVKEVASYDIGDSTGVSKYFIDHSIKCLKCDKQKTVQKCFKAEFFNLEKAVSRSDEIKVKRPE